ncbi:hypothetical protein Gpo141_00012433, partial [Globisporangium polare]
MAADPVCVPCSPSVDENLEFSETTKHQKTSSENGSDTHTHDSTVTSSSASADPTLTSASTPTSVFLSDEHEA